MGDPLADPQAALVAPDQLLTVIVPCFNEQERIARTIEQTASWFGARGQPVELLAVDDGSSDLTRPRLEELAARLPVVRVLGYPRNRGKGYAVRHGVQASHGDPVLYMDADLATPIEEYLRLRDALATADIAFGSRALSGSTLLVRQPRYREYMGRTFNLLVRALAVPGVHDTQCGFKLLRRTCALHLFPLLTSDSYSFDVELLMLARRYGYRLAEVPVRWQHIPLSRVHPVLDSARMALDLLRLRLRHLGQHQPPPAPPG